MCPPIFYTFIFSLHTSDTRVRGRNRAGIIKVREVQRPEFGVEYGGRGLLVDPGLSPGSRCPI